MQSNALEVSPADAAVEGIGPGVPPDQPIKWAGAIATLIHALAFLLVGVAGLRAAATHFSPSELRLTLDLTGGRGEEHAASVEQRIGPLGKSAEAVPTSRASAPRPLVAARGRSMPSTAAPKAVESQHESVSAAGSAAGSQDVPASADAPREAASPGAAEPEPVLATTAASDREEPAQLDVAPRQPAVAVASAQQSLLARWIEGAIERVQDSNLTGAQFSMSHHGQRYTASIERHPAADDMDIDHVRVEITTVENGKLLRTSMLLKRLAFSHYTQLVDVWTAGYQMHADEIQGRFHTNSELTIYPDLASRVAGKLTTAADRVNVPNGDASALSRIFLGGVQTEAQRIALRDAYPTYRPERGDGTSGRSFARPTRLTFYPDGTYGWWEVGSGAAEQREAIGARHYIVGAHGAWIGVQGTVSGKVVIYSPERISIEGNLVYAHDPRSNPASEDYLGLISNQDVEIAPTSVTGPGDLHVEAAIYAKHTFVVRDFQLQGRRVCPCGATLFMYGSLTAGTLAESEARYATRFAFDGRFERLRPPGFPLTGHYEVESWDNEWREAAAPAAEAPPPPVVQ